MNWDHELTALIKRAQGANPTARDGAALVVLARLRDALGMGRERELADRCLRLTEPTNRERTVA